MKQILKLSLLLTLLLPATALAYDFEVDGIYYLKNGNEATVTYRGASSNQYSDEYTGEVIIPETVTFNDTTYLVTRIGSSTFSNCTELINVTIPNSVTDIGDYAFLGCSGLISIDLPSSITNISNSTFHNCSSLASINVASSNPKYDSRNNCNAIIETATNTIITGCKNTVIPNSVTSIGNGAFAGCTELTGIDIPNSVRIIGEGAFDSCTNLANIIIPNSVTSIDYNAFFECSNLVSITIDNSCTSVARDAFYGCFGVKRINITDIAAWCQNNFVSFFEGDGLWNYHTYNLYLNDEVVRDLTIPSSVTSISEMAFLCCGSLTNVNIPNSVTSIGTDAFKGCTSLTSICIPNSVSSIGMGAFHNCTGLKSISIPSSVTEIGDWAFFDCIGLDDVYCYILDPTLLIGTNMRGYWDWGGDNPSSHRTLHVPAGSIELYKSDWDWSEAFFGTIVEMDSHLEMPDTSLLCWETVTIPVVLCNDRNVLAFQTDIVLPEGLSIATNEEDEYMIAPSSRFSSDHILMASDYGNGVVRVVCYTPEGQPIEGYTGDLFYITVKVPEDAGGEYPIILRNSRLTTEDYTELRIPDATAIINVKTYIPGDANNSRSVTVTDIVVTAQYVLGRNPQPFIYDAADMNGDGDVSVTDIMLIAYMLQHPSLNAPLRVPAQTANNDRMSADAISLIPGETRTINIMLDNDLDYSAFQLDLTLPEGLTASNFALTDRAGGHAFDVNAIDDSKLRALCYSPELETINGHEGALLTFDVTAMAQVTGNIIVDAIELVTDGCQTVEMGAFNIQVNNSSAVNEVVNGKAVARVEYFNVAGQQIAMPTSGITIIVTTYTDGTRSTTKLHL